jgi:hypothetical protein
MFLSKPEIGLVEGVSLGKGLRIPVRIGCLLVLMLTPCPCGWSTWVNTTTPVPVERLLNNVTKYVKEHPQNAQGYYVLGRLTACPSPGERKH